MAPQPEHLRSAQSVRNERDATLAHRYGGFYWGADFIGFAVAMFFLLVFLGIVAAAVGTVGYQLGTPLPHTAGAVSSTQQSLGIGGAIGSLIAVFLAYLIGGYAAGRMARFSGMKNGIGVVIWTVIVVIILGVVGSVLGSKFNVASQIHLKINPSTLTTAGIISLVVTVVVMVLGSILGGWMGVRFHRHIDHLAVVTP